MKTILTFANKQDLPRGKSVSQLIQDYEFDKIKHHIWQIKAYSSLKGEGLVTGIKWLGEQLVFVGKNNFPINPYLINENDGINDKGKKENIDVSINVNNSEEIFNSNNNIKTDEVNDISKMEGKKKE